MHTYWTYKLSTYPNSHNLLHIALTNISNFMQFTLHYQKQQERLKQMYIYLIYITAELTQLSSRVQLYCGSQALSV